MCPRELSRKIKNYFESNENKTQLIKMCEMQQSSVLKGNCSIECIYEKRKTNKINYLSFHLRKWEKEEQIKLKINRRKEITKITAEINEI